MGAKRALIVDDSKSARVSLSRMLEKHELDVDNVETAEAAIEYLGHHRPDVIFMDHMMPGMDGFQAVQAIKNNPRTATIPIMMYTSQEGELYLGQARALGAVGVLPKQIKPADVSKVLYQLHLLADRRSREQSSFQPLDLNAIDEVGEVTVPAGLAKPLNESALRDQFADLRRALMANMDTQSERIFADVRTLLYDALPVHAAPAASSSWMGWIAGLSLGVALTSTVMWWHEASLRNALGAELAAAHAATVAHPSAPPPAPVAAVPVAHKSAAASETRTLMENVPFGEDPLGGSHLDRVSLLLHRLVRENFHGVVDIKTFPGRFCLIGNATDGYSLAPDEMLYSKCDVVGAAREDATQSAKAMSLPLANLISEIRHASHGAVDVQLTAGDAAAAPAPYPPVTPDLTAGEWNRAGSANNRLEIRVR